MINVTEEKGEAYMSENGNGISIKVYGPNMEITAVTDESHAPLMAKTLLRILIESTDSIAAYAKAKTCCGGGCPGDEKPAD